uniref:Tectonic family member 1 n=1 Tax=Angiostrongylus cantonensis TaxID=6313 RepID=A0A0K0CWN8_ANGCA
MFVMVTSKMDKKQRSVEAMMMPLLTLLNWFPSVFGCGPVLPGQEKNLAITIYNFTLPVSMAFGGSQTVLSQAPNMSISEQTAKAFTQNLVSGSVIYVLKEEGRRLGVPDGLMSTIIEEIYVKINYEPLRCAAVKVNPVLNAQLPPSDGDNKRESCFIVEDTVTNICPLNNATIPQTCQLVGGTAAIPVPSKHLRIDGILTVGNAFLATWTTQQWQTVLSRISRLLAAHDGTNFLSAAITVS